MSKQFNGMAEMRQSYGKISRGHRIAMTEYHDTANKCKQCMRVEQRTNNWLHLTMGGLFLLILLLISIVYTMTLYTKSVSAQLQVLHQQFNSTTAKLATLQKTPTYISHTYSQSLLSQAPIQLPDISLVLKSIEAELYHLNGDMHQAGDNELKQIVDKKQVALNSIVSKETFPILYY